MVRKARAPKDPMKVAGERLVTWATTFGAPVIILEGWNPEDGTWSGKSPVGILIAMVSRGTFVTTAAKNAGVRDISKLLSRGAEYAHDAPEERAFIPIDILPFIDIARQVELAEAYHEYTLTNTVNKAALNDPDLALKMLARRHAARWREQATIYTPDVTDERDKAISRLIADDPAAAMALAALAHKIEDATDDEA